MLDKTQEMNMLLNKGRKEFIEYMLESEDDIVSQRERYDFFVEKTGGKLYKYRSFDTDGHALENLNSQTLYCAHPSKFNDPFDLKFGVDVLSLISGALTGGIDTEGLVGKFVQVCVGTIKIEDLSPNEQQTIKYWQNRGLYDNLFCMSKTEQKEENLVQQVLEKPETILLILEGIITNKEVLDILRNNWQKAVAQWQLLIGDCPKRGIKVDSFRDIFRNIGDGDEIANLPLVFEKVAPERIQQGIEAMTLLNETNTRLEEIFEKNFIVGCLADTYDNRILWSRYADDHKGFCIEYDFTGFEELDKTPYPVVYSRDRVKFPWHLVIGDQEKSNREVGKYGLKAMMTKDDVWEYENEWRIVLAEEEPRNVKLPRVSCIFVGVRCSEKDKEKLQAIAHEKGIPINQMTLDRGEYGLNVVKIN